MYKDKNIVIRSALDDNLNKTIKSNGVSSLDEVNEEPSVNEWKIGLCGLVACLLVISAKLFYIYRKELSDLLLEQRLITYETITEDGQVMFRHGWKVIVKFSSIWVPAVCGLLTMYFTGLIVYLDSYVPGVQPPSPFSPSKYKTRSGHTFHMNYIIAVVMGILVSGYMYWKQVSLEF